MTFTPAASGVRHDARGLAGARHPGLVEDQHRRAAPEAARVGVEVEREARERPRLRDAGLLGELAHPASRRRGPQHTEAPGRVGLGEQARREGLARPGQRLDALHPVTACGQATDHGRLLGRRREGRAREHRVDERAIEHAGAFAAACLRAVHDRLLVGEQVARGEPPLSGVRGTVHVAAREELRGGALDRLGRCALAVGGRPRHHRLACCERVLLLGQPGRAGQLAAHQPQIRDLGCVRRPAGKRLELAGAEAVLGRPGAHDLLPRRGVDPVALALTRVVRDRLTPRAPHLDAGR